MTGMKADTSKFDAWAKKMLSLDKQIAGALQTIVYPFLFDGDQSRQFLRWQSKGASEGSPWRPLTQKYAKQKLRRFAKFPGGGTRLLVATSRLLSANTGRPEESGDINKLIMNGVLYVRIGVPYAKFVHKFKSGGINRDIMRFAPETYAEMKALVKGYFADKVRQ